MLLACITIRNEETGLAVVQSRDLLCTPTFDQ